MSSGRLFTISEELLLHSRSLFSNEPAELRGNPLDTLCATLEKKMQYETGERVTT